MDRTITLLTPVFDDWASFAALVTEIAERFRGCGVLFRVCAIDDGSSAAFDPADIDLPAGSAIAAIEVIRLAANLGHQRAIAVGLCAAVEDGEGEADALLVMDSDGQDRPCDIDALLGENARHPRHVVVAGRARRSEPRLFRFCYFLYRLIFRALTGQRIDFGNFSLIPIAAARRLVHMPELWNNLAASVMRSRLPYRRVPTMRGNRFAGRSTMNFVGLIVHGFSAMSVYGDVIFVRVLVAAVSIAALSCLGIGTVVFVRTATDLAIPGWATAAVGDLLIMLLQTLVIVVAACLTMLAGRSNRPMIPIVDCPAFIAERGRVRLDRDIPAATAPVCPAA